MEIVKVRTTGLAVRNDLIYSGCGVARWNSSIEYGQS